jgi:cytochrome c553
MNSGKEIIILCHLTKTALMKKVLKWLGIIVIILIVALFGFLKFFMPNVGNPPDVKVDVTPARVARGEYLANCVTLCMDCHSKRDWTTFTAPPMPGTAGAGGEEFNKSMGFPGTFYSRNLTPYRLKEWSDGEIFRAITTGVDKKGEPLFPVMPYHLYGQLDNEDIYSIIAYLRSLPEIKNEIPASKADFPFSLIMRTIPTKGNPQKLPAESDTMAYGKYMVTATGCIECHTKFEKGQFVEGTEYGGGRVFEMPGGTLQTANISPDMETGIGTWTEDVFVRRFKMYTDSTYVPLKVDPTKDFITMMPWSMYAKMKESDLRAIYKYLRTVKIQSNKVVKWQPRAAAIAAK